MLTFAAKYGKNVFSQFGEDGIIEEICKRLNITNGKVCEFGAHNGEYCSNSRNLILQGWEALLIEGDKELATYCWDLYASNRKVQVYCDFVIPQNVNLMLHDDDIKEFDILSIDVDGIDGAIWEAYIGKPKIVIIEINSNLAPLSNVFADPARGSSYSAMLELGTKKGYSLICHTGNMIFVDSKYSKLFPELKNTSPQGDWNLYFNKSWQ